MLRLGMLVICAALLAACSESEEPKKVPVEEASGPPLDDEIADFNRDLTESAPPEPERAPVIEEVEPLPGRAAVAPDTLDLGFVEQGQMPDPHTASISNVGESPMTIFSIRALEGRARVLNGCPGVLAPGASCEVQVQLRSDEIAENFSDVLIVETDGDNRRVGIALSGAVFAPVAPEETEVGPTMAELMERERRRRLGLARGKSLKAMQVGFKEPETAPPEPQKTEYLANEPDYTALEGITEVRATYPVNNCRIMKEGTRIMAALDTSVLTEQEGPVRAVSSQNIVSPCGNILVPAGSEIFGTAYPSEDSNDSRALIVWHRIVRAKDNASFVFGGVSADMAGRAGVPGIVYSRTLEKYGLTGALIGLSALVTFLTPVDDDQASAAVGDATNKLGQLSAQTLEENMDIKSIIEAPKGGIITVIAHMQDVYFPEPKPLSVATK